MKTKFLLIITVLVFVLSCKEANKEDNITSKIEGKYIYVNSDETRSDKGYKSTMNITHVEDHKYSIEFTDIKNNDPTNIKKDYGEYEYRPEEKILFFESLLGTSSFQFSEDYEILTQLDGVLNTEYVKQ